jgi:hypothetical protein
MRSEIMTSMEDLLSLDRHSMMRVLLKLKLVRLIALGKRIAHVEKTKTSLPPSKPRYSHY